MTNLTSVPASIGNEVPIAIASWLACLAMVLVIGLMIMNVVEKVRGKAPHPPNKQLESSLESLDRRVESDREAWEKHVDWNRREHENLFSKIGGVERGQNAKMDTLSREWRQFVETEMKALIQSNNAGREKLHERINTILAEVSEIRGVLKARAHN